MGTAEDAWSEGAHCGAIPFVPWPQVTTGYPPTGAWVFGTITTPVTATGRPSSVSDRYITR